MKWIALFWLPFVSGSCRTTKFVQEEGVALQNHVIKTVTATAPIICRSNCVDEPLCFSINVRKLPSGRVTCELNNSSKTADSQDLINTPGSQYHQMAEVEQCTTEQCIHKDALPDGWYRFGSKLLKLFPEKRDWGKAESICKENGGELVSIKSEYENEFISHLLDQIETSTAGTDPNQTINHWILDGSDSNVTLKNGALYVKEDGVNCLYLKGSRHGPHATTPVINFGQTSITMAAWVKLQGDPPNHPSTIYGFWGRPPIFLFDVYVFEKLRFLVKNTQGVKEPLINVTVGTPPINKWFHAAAVWDREEKKAQLFLDGQELGAQAVPNYAFFQDATEPFYDIGLKRDAGYTLKGYLRDLIIIRSALNGEKLTKLADPFGGVWIGLNDVSTEGNFVWPDGSHVTYNKWSPSLHNNQEHHDCVRLTVDKGAWDATSCIKELPFVCEKNV